MSIVLLSDIVLWSRSTDHKTFFVPWKVSTRATRRRFWIARRKIDFVPFLIMQGALHDNVLRSMQEHFVKTYKAAGGDCEYRLFENSVQESVAEFPVHRPTRRARLKALIASN